MEEKTKNKKMVHKGFTLAETLITLIIIGVVAALTVPTLITRHQKEETALKLKNDFVIIEEAVRLSEVDNGSITTWKIPGAGDANVSQMHVVANKAFLDKYIKPYMKVDTDCTESETSTCKPIPNPWPQTSKPYYLANGTKLGFMFLGSDWEAPPGGTHAIIRVDINGDKGPDKVGRDIFLFNIGTDNDQIYPYFYSRSYNWKNKTRDEIINCPNSSARCTANSGKECCTALIIKDNWTIADDYPW